MIRNIIGLLAIVAAVIGGLYVAFVVCIFGGIVQVIEAAKQTPIHSAELAWGIVRFFCAGLCGWLTFGVGLGIANVCFSGSRRRY